MRRDSGYGAVRDAIYRAAVRSDPGQWRETLEILADHIGADGAMLVYNAPAGQPSSILTSRLREDLSRLYLDRYVWNPWTRAIARCPLGKAVSANSVAEWRSVKATAFHADILAPQAIRDLVVVAQPSVAAFGGTGGFGLSLNERQAERADEAIRRLDRLQPHLARAMDISLSIAERQDGARQLESVLDLLVHPALLLGAQGEIVHANPPAERLLTADDGLTISLDVPARLKATLPHEDLLLKKRMFLALANLSDETVELHGHGHVRISRPSGKAPFFALISALPRPAFEICAAQPRARLLVFIVDATTPLPAAAYQFCLSFGLTQAEAKLALLIGSGRTGSEAVAALGVAPSTVKSQLASIYQKLGVRSQVALTRLLALVPSSKPESGSDKI